MPLQPGEEGPDPGVLVVPRLEQPVALIEEEQRRTQAGLTESTLSTSSGWGPRLGKVARRTFLPMALATPKASIVLPVPGGLWNSIVRPRP